MEEKKDVGREKQSGEKRMLGNKTWRKEEEVRKIAEEIRGLEREEEEEEEEKKKRGQSPRRRKREEKTSRQEDETEKIL